MIRRGKKFCLDIFYLDDSLCQIMVLGAISYTKTITISSTAAENSLYMGVHWVLVRLFPRMHQNSVFLRRSLHLLNSNKQPEYSFFCKQKKHDVYKRR